jgi:hypothetical protein
LTGPASTWSNWGDALNGPFADICCASLPAAALAALGEVRCTPDVRVALAGERVLVSWRAGDDRVLARLLPVAGVAFYAHRDGRWFRHDRRLPAFDFPGGLDYRPLHQVLTPAAVRAIAPGAVELALVRLELVIDDRPRPITALVCGLAELARWTDTVPAVRLASMRTAHADGRALLLGQRLPLLPGGERFWGEGVLVPLGRRPEPDLPASALREALGVGADDILLLARDSPEIIPRAALAPLTRAAVRRANGEGL